MFGGNKSLGRLYLQGVSFSLSVHIHISLIRYWLGFFPGASRLAGSHRWSLTPLLQCCLTSTIIIITLAFILCVITINISLAVITAVIRLIPSLPQLLWHYTNKDWLIDRQCFCVVVVLSSINWEISRSLFLVGFRLDVLCILILRLTS